MLTPFNERWCLQIIGETKRIDCPNNTDSNLPAQGFSLRRKAKVFWFIKSFLGILVTID